MNSIDAKQYNFLQQNLPGNDGYGQIGVRGNTGIDGNSVYFTPYVMSTEQGMSQCRELIMAGKELSDNKFYDNKDVVYNTNDLIIDKLGDVYTLRFVDNPDAETNEIENIIYLTNIFSEGSITGNALQCTLKCDESADSSSYYRGQPNSACLGEYDPKTCSPYIYHRDRYIGRLCGSWLYFSITIPESDYGNFIYKYTLLFPNGQRLEKMTENSTCEIFVDNRYVYSCRPSDSSIAELFGTLSYNNVNNNQEYAYEFSNLIADYIVNECMAYVEISDKESRNVYRVYADTIMRPEIENNQENNG